MKWFKKPSTRYNPTQETQSPFARARQVWDERMGTAVSQRDHWRALAVATTALALIVVVPDKWLRQRQRPEVFIHVADRSGQPGRVERLDPDHRVPTELIADTVRRLVEWVRSISTDPVVVRKNWEQAYKHLAADAAAKMNQYAASLALNQPGRVRARSVEVSSVLQRSASSFQVTWVEHTYLDGSLEKTERYTGLFTYKIQPPATPEEVFDNSLGVFVTDFSWSKEYDSNL